MIHVSVAERASTRTFSFSQDEVVVGSAADADLVLDQPGVAERHIRIAVRDRVLVIEDLRSTNRPPRAVEPADIVRIAGINLKMTHGLGDADLGRQLLGEIRQRPDDPAPRTVYADWCEEHGHPERAEFLRLQIAVAEAKTATDPDFVRAAARLAALAPDVGNTWRASVAMAFIERCPTTTPQQPGASPPAAFGLELVCPMRWDKLAPTDREDVRSCSGCHREVTYCTTITQARAVAVKGGCVAVDFAAARRPHDLDMPTRRLSYDDSSLSRLTVGRPSPRGSDGWGSDD